MQSHQGLSADHTVRGCVTDVMLSAEGEEAILLSADISGECVDALKCFTLTPLILPSRACTVRSSTPATTTGAALGV